MTMTCQVTTWQQQNFLEYNFHFYALLALEGFLLPPFIISGKSKVILLGACKMKKKFGEMQVMARHMK